MLRLLTPVRALARGPASPSAQECWLPVPGAHVCSNIRALHPAGVVAAVRRPLPRLGGAPLAQVGAVRTSAAQRRWRRTLRARGGEQVDAEQLAWQLATRWFVEPDGLQLAPGLEPRAEQPEAVKKLVELLRPLEGSPQRMVTLSGATGTGKTFTVANVMAKLQRPALLLVHNKELAYQHFRTLGRYFPNNSVGLLTSPFKFYLPARVEEQTKTQGKKLVSKQVLGKKKSTLDEESFERRQVAMQSIRKNEIPIIVASSSALFPAHHPDVDVKAQLQNEEVLKEIISKIQKELYDEVQRLAQRSEVAAQNLQDTVQKDLTKLQKNRTCADLFDKYSHHLPEEWCTTPMELFREHYKQKWVLVIDESHVTLPHLMIAHAAVYSRKKKLVEAGFYLPSSLLCRPLKMEETFKLGAESVILASATPDEKHVKTPVVEMVQRPTHILDPEIELVQQESSHHLEEIRKERDRGNQVLVTCVTMRASAALAQLIGRGGVKASYLNCGLPLDERNARVEKFRKGKLDVLVGVNLFREGLDFPRVSLVIVLDADHPGFLRTTAALTQTVGRAARHPNGRAIFVYNKQVTEHMRRCVQQTQERRRKQMEYNQKHGYLPKPIEHEPDRSESEEEDPESEEEDAGSIPVRDEATFCQIPGNGPQTAARLLHHIGPVEKVARLGRISL